MIFLSCKYNFLHYYFSLNKNKSASIILVESDELFCHFLLYLFKKMDRLHWLLILFWVLYYTVHSLLAATAVKVYAKKWLGPKFRYYRLAYTIFATITLTWLLIFQYSFESPLLIESTILKYASLLVFVIPGAIIMGISLKKYFMLLSGVRSVFESVSTPELKITGIHRFVRHPLYSGTILFTLGLFFIFPRLNNLVAVTLLALYVLVGIVFEEKKLLKEFGKQYEDYMREVPGLLPNFRSGK